jgi:hypothetical protein
MACREHGWIRWISTTYCDQNHVREWPWQLETSSNHQPDSSGHWQGQTCLTFGRTVTKVTKCEKRFEDIRVFFPNMCLEDDSPAENDQLLYHICHFRSQVRALRLCGGRHPKLARCRGDVHPVALLPR